MDRSARRADRSNSTSRFERTISWISRRKNKSSNWKSGECPRQTVSINSQYRPSIMAPGRPANN